MIDIINPFDFPDGENLLNNAMRIAPQLARLKARCRRHDIPTIYVNDNFGAWRSDVRSVVEHCLKKGAAGRNFVHGLMPDDNDHFVLKPKHSAFFQTPLDFLLRHLDVRTLILTGLATNSCIVSTAHDANMRDFSLRVPSDCSAARTMREHQEAIAHIHEMANACVSPSRSIRMTNLSSWGKKRRNE
jgi:nicotinamidase-related amidase